MKIQNLIRLSITLVVSVLIGSSATALAADEATANARDQFLSARAHLQAQVAQALQSGLSAAEVAPITAEAAAVSGRAAPQWPGDASAFYLDGARAEARIEAELGDLGSRLVQRETSAGDLAMSDAANAVSHARDLGVPDSDLAPLLTRLSAARDAASGARTLSEHRSVNAQLTSLVADLTALSEHQQAETAAIQQAGAALLQQTAGNVDAVRKAGSDALGAARNDASVAAYEALPGRFSRIDALMQVQDRVEYYGGGLGAAEVDKVALAAAAVQRYGAQVHALMVAGLQSKHLIVSFQAQHVWAYQDGAVVMETAATTGIRGITAYGTDFGPMKILFRSHPWTMRSPWPPGNVHYYPPTVVQWTAFFTNSGESFHDAYWEPDSALGPGSQFSPWTRSHGCIHVPYSDAQWMYNWAVEGTPVDVFPGNGQPVNEQLSEMTTDDQGNPLNPA